MSCNYNKLNIELFWIFGFNKLLTFDNKNLTCLKIGGIVACWMYEKNTWKNIKSKLVVNNTFNQIKQVTRCNFSISECCLHWKPTKGIGCDSTNKMHIGLFFCYMKKTWHLMWMQSKWWGGLFITMNQIIEIVLHQVPIIPHAPKGNCSI
jgi:hypothetical protein